MTILHGDTPPVDRQKDRQTGLKTLHFRILSWAVIKGILPVISAQPAEGPAFVGFTMVPFTKNCMSIILLHNQDLPESGYFGRSGIYVHTSHKEDESQSGNSNRDKEMTNVHNLGRKIVLLSVCIK